MTSPAREGAPDIHSVDVDALQALYDGGRYLDLHTALRPFVVEDYVQRLDLSEVIVRNARQLLRRGESRRAVRRMLAAHPDSTLARSYAIEDCINELRVRECFEWIHDHGPGDVRTARDELLWYSACCGAYSRCRDFERAEYYLARAKEAAPDDFWWQTDAVALEFERDAPAKALELCEHSIETCRPDSSLMYWQAFLLHTLGRSTEAITNLEPVAAARQSFSLDGLLGDIRYESGDVPGAITALEAMLERYGDVIGRLRRQRLHARLTTMCLAADRRDDARRHAELAGKATEKTLTALQESGGDGSRVVLDVPFVRQDFMTCVPATMASLLAFGGVEIDQRTIAEEITYDGTPDFKTWRWAVDRGMVVHFFEFDLETMRALIDRGVAFSISTRFPYGSHLQGLIGYDAAAGHVVLREPSSAFLRVVPQQTLLDEARARGGRCALVIRPEWADRLEGIDLPQAEACLAFIRYEHARDERQLDRVADDIALLESLEPGPVAWDYREGVAYEHEDWSTLVAIAKERLERFPDDEWCRLRYVEALRGAARWNEYMPYLEDLARREPLTPAIGLEFASQLAEHSSSHGRAVREADRALRRFGFSRHGLKVLAGMLWSDVARRDLAIEIYRASSTVDVHSEDAAMRYSRALQHVDRNTEAIDYLRSRAERLAARSSIAFGSLAQTLSSLDRRAEAITELERAIERHDDPWLREILVSELLATGRYDDARASIEAATGVIRPLRFHSLRYRLEIESGNRAGGLTALDEILTIAPLDGWAHERRLPLVHELRDREAAVAEGLRLLERHPGAVPVSNAVAEFFQSIDENDRAERVLRDLADAHPDQLWMRGSLGRHLISTGKVEEGLALAESLVEDSSNPSPAACFDVAHAHRLLGNREAARDAWIRLLDIAPQATRNTVRGLLQTAGTREEFEAALDRVLGAFRTRQPDGDALEEFLHQARRVWEDERIDGLVDELLTEYPESREVAMAACERRLAARDWKGAETAARASHERWPWLTTPVISLFHALDGQDRTDEARTLLREWIDGHADAVSCYTALGESFEHTGEVDAAEALYREGLAAVQDGTLYGYLAELQWRRGDAEGALESITRAEDLRPGYSWAIDTHADWLIQLGRHDEARALTESFVALRPSWPDSHRIHADVLSQIGLHAESIDVAYEALRLDPTLGNTRLRMINSLSELRRFDEAREVLAKGFEIYGDEDASLMLAAAKLQRAEGDHDGAREACRRVTERHPDFRGAWSRYLEWLDDDDRDTELLALYANPPEALRDNSSLYTYAGDCFLRDDEEDAGIAALRKALELEPEHQWARGRLAGVLLDAKRDADAGEVLKDVPDPDGVAPQLAMFVATHAVRTGDHERARAYLLRALREEGIAAKRATVVLDALGDEAAREISDAARAADPFGYAAPNLAAIQVKADRKREYFELLDSVHGEGNEQVLARVIAAAAYSSFRRELGEWIHDHLRAPIADVLLWGTLGWVLEDVFDDWVIEYMRDDYTRVGAEGWMLANLAASLRRTGDLAKMREVSEHALTLRTDHSKWWHRMYLGYAAYQDGAYAEAAELCSIPIRYYPGLRLEAHGIETAARAHLAGGWLARRKVVRRALPKLCELWDAATSDRPNRSYEPRDYHADLLWDACRCDLTWLLRRPWGRKRLAGIFG